MVADGVIAREEYAAVGGGTVACLELHRFPVIHSTVIVHGPCRISGAAI